MRAHCRSKDNGGKLPEGIPEPRFLADPSHRIKCMSKPIFNMVTSPPVKDPGRAKNIDACRVKKYSGCCIAKNKMISLDEFCSKAKAPIEHLFNCHTWCDAEWCWAKELDEATHKMMMTVMVNKVSNLPFCCVELYLDIISYNSFQSPVSKLHLILLN